MNGVREWMDSQPGRWMCNGRKPSKLWREVAAALAPVAPHVRIAELRASGATWVAVGRALADECDLESAPTVPTLQFWAKVVPPHTHA